MTARRNVVQMGVAYRAGLETAARIVDDASVLCQESSVGVKRRLAKLIRDEKERGE